MLKILNEVIILIMNFIFSSIYLYVVYKNIYYTNDIIYKYRVLFFAVAMGLWWVFVQENIKRTKNQNLFLKIINSFANIYMPIIASILYINLV